MKTSSASSLRRGFSLLLALVCVLSVCAAGAPMTVSAEDDAGYISPAYTVDFSTSDGIDKCNGLYHLSTACRDGAMQILFEDTGNGSCFDPYMNLPIPAGVDCTKYHILTMLVKTNRADKRGEFRFRTETTGDAYPCQAFRYADTDDWQLITVDLTDKNTVMYLPSDTRPTGNFTNLRLDMFDNECAPDTQYFIKAIGLYDNAEDAATFIHYVSQAETETEEKPVQPDVDYSSFWRGQDFATPALPMRMRWVSYGFTGTSPIDTFLRQGYGGVVSNVMMDTTYLKNDAQFRLLAEVYEYADSLGMKAWIYDEYQWPSGKAFGMVLEGHDELEATGIQHLELTGSGGNASYTVSGNELRVMCAVLTDANGRQEVSPADGLGSPSVEIPATGDWTLDVYVLRKTYEGVEDRNDFTTLRHVDLLNPATTARFIELTHEAYKAKMGDAFRLVEAFFTDEPQLGNRAMVGYAVWTEGFAERFRATYGFELHIPSIFEGDTDFDRLNRMNYYQLVATLFRESYCQQITDWCEANGTRSSGHLLFEENMNDQIETYGGDFLQVVGAMSIPGVDLLWVSPERLMSQNYIGSNVGIRYVASAAKNAGKRDVMVEFNPDAANSLSKEDPLGTCIGGASVTRLMGTTIYNVINPQFSLTGDEYARLNEYVGRLNTLLDGATECGEVGVFYPIATVQAYHNADTGHGSETLSGNTDAAKIDSRFQTLCRSLLTNRYLYTVLDDESIRNATVTADGHLCVGLGAYKAVILPMTEYISVEALDKLVTFTKAGGTVLFYGNKPQHGLAAGQDEEIAALMAQLAEMPAYIVSSKQIYKDLDAYVHRDITLDASAKELSDFLMGDFETEDRDITYIVNTAAEARTVGIRYTDGYQGTVSVYFPINGDIRTFDLSEGEIRLTVPTNQAILVVREADNRHDRTPYVPEVETQPETEPQTEPVTTPAEETTAETESVTVSDTSGETGSGEKKGCSSALSAPPALLLCGVAIASVLRLRRRRKC